MNLTVGVVLKNMQQWLSHFISSIMHLLPNSFLKLISQYIPKNCTKSTIIYILSMLNLHLTAQKGNDLKHVNLSSYIWYILIIRRPYI